MGPAGPLLQVERHTRARGRPPNTWNPVIAAPGDVKERMALDESERQEFAKSVTRGLQRDLDVSFVTYNVLNFAPKFGLTAQQADECLHPPRTSGLRHSKPAETPFNIINLEHKTHLPPVREVSHLKHGEFRRKWDRDFNVINGNYHADNATKRQQEADHAKAVLLRRVAESEEYHPIAGRFYNDQKEAALLAQEQRLNETKKAQVHVVNHPPSAAGGEGAAFDILSGTEYDGAKCAALGVRDDARLTAIAGLRQRHAARCDAVDDLAERQEHSALLRYQRPQAAWDSVVHGHDILNGKPLGLTAGELKVCSDADRHSHTLQGRQPPPVSLRLLRPIAVSDRLAQVAERTAAAEALLAGPSSRDAPLTSFEKTMNRTSSFTATANKLRFKK
eukprot:EG_transcript_16169